MVMLAKFYVPNIKFPPNILHIIRSCVVCSKRILPLGPLDSTISKPLVVIADNTIWAILSLSLFFRSRAINL